MSAIFISHSSRDNTWAERIRNCMEKHGYKGFFLDFDDRQGIEAGTEWRGKIYAELRRCRAVIALCSEHFVASQWCLSEVAIATDQGKHLLPVRIGDGSLPNLVKPIQAIDLRKDEQKGLEKLLRGLADHLDWKDKLAWPPSDRKPPVSPYPGLPAFQREDAPVFFGRDGEIDEAVERLTRLRDRRIAMLTVLGASGCGKSSLMRAGILPCLRQDKASWLVLEPFIAGATEPFERLNDVLSAAFLEKGLTPPDPPRTAKGFLEPLRTLRRECGQREASVVLALDQFEELLQPGERTRESGELSEADQFVYFLADVAQRSDGLVMVMATMRSDFLGLLQLHPAGLRRLGDQYLLDPMLKEKFIPVIEGPALRAGLKVERDLSQRMADDTASGEALPLLAFTLEKLWKKYGKDGDLTLDEYKTSGGPVSYTHLTLPTNREV